MNFPDDSIIGVLGDGYIASNLLEKLSTQKENLQIHSFNRSNISFIRNYEFDYFFNCTGITGDFRSNITKTIESNIELTNFLLKNLRINSHLVTLSSTRLYGFSSDESELFKEDSITYQNHLNIDFIYDGSKLLLESMLKNESVHLSYRCIVLRLSNVIGKFTSKMLDASTFLKVLIKDKIENRSTCTNQNPHIKKDYVYIDDVIESIIQSTTIDDKFCILNVASGESLDIIDLSKIFNFDIHIGSDLSYSKYYSNISTKKIENLISYSPRKISTLKFNELIK